MKEVDLHLYVFSSFCVHGIPMSEREAEGGEARQVSIVRAKGTSQILPFGRSNCEANAGGSAMPVQHYGAGLLILAMQC